MTALSSIRAHDRSEVYRVNQINAKRSWEAVFDRIVYFSRMEPELDSPKTIWIQSEEWPRIHELAEYAGQQRGVTAIINADIFVGPRLIDVLKGMQHSTIQGMTSRRYDYATGNLNPDDKGRDIFVLKQHGWRLIARHVPRSCRIGHNEWDSWMIGFMRKTFGKRFADFTLAKCIFHPEHEERERPYGNEVDISGPYKGYWDGTFDTQIVINEPPRMAG